MASSPRLPPFGSSHPDSPRLSSAEATWEVESEIYGDDFSVCTGKVHSISHV
jgi:hypothetical protein